MGLRRKRGLGSGLCRSSYIEVPRFLHIKKTDTTTMKPIYQSKTFWLNFIAMLCMFIPQVKTWLNANPETAVSVLTALNILVRFATSGKISLFGAGENDANTGSGMVPCWLVGIATAGLCLGLPSCSPETRALLKEYPIKGCYSRDGIKVCASTKSGMDIEVDQTSGK